VVYAVKESMNDDASASPSSNILSNNEFGRFKSIQRVESLDLAFPCHMSFLGVEFATLNPLGKLSSFSPPRQNCSRAVFLFPLRLSTSTVCHFNPRSQLRPNETSTLDAEQTLPITPYGFWVLLVV
jgi:hypothetical protein